MVCLPRPLSILFKSLGDSLFTVKDTKNTKCF